MFPVKILVLPMAQRMLDTEAVAWRTSEEVFI